MIEESEIQLGQVFAQSQQNAQQLDSLGRKLDGAISELRTTIEQTGERAERLIEQVRRSTSPNMGNIWMGIGVAIAFLSLCAGAFGFGVNREINRLDVNFDKLDSKLQREQNLMTESVRQQVEGVRAQVVTLDERRWELLRDDLNELRTRRMKTQ